MNADTGTYGRWELEIFINGEIVQTVTASTSIALNEHLKFRKKYSDGKGSLHVRHLSSGNPHHRRGKEWQMGYPLKLRK